MQIVLKNQKLDLKIKGEVPYALVKFLRTLYGKNLEVSGDFESSAVKIKKTGKAGKLIPESPNERVRFYRLQNEWSLTDLSSRLGTKGRAFLSEIENGKRYIGRALAENLAAVFGTDYTEFYNPKIPAKILILKEKSPKPKKKK